MNETVNENVLIKNKLNQWFTNDEIFKILTQELGSSNNQIQQLPKNGSVFIFDRKLVKNYKKDGFAWKCRKTATKSVREDRMCLKINGQVCIYGCYSHSCLIPSFHRRIYWLLNKPDIVLVHYLQIPNNDSGESFITFESIGTDIQLSYEQVAAQLRSMLWPYYLNKDFVSENIRLNCFCLPDDSTESIDFITFICNKFYMMKKNNLNISNRNNDSFKISFNNLNTSIQVTESMNQFSSHRNFKTNKVKLSIDYCFNQVSYYFCTY
jgi:hypothetical protein